MATTTGTMIAYDSFKREMLNKQVRIEGTPDTYIVGLSTSAYTPDRSAHEILTDITNEVVTAGYVRQTLANVALTEPTPGTWRMDADDPVFSPSGSDLTARWWWMFNDTSTSPLDLLCFYGLLDDSVADVVTPDGETLTFQVNASGIFELAGGET